NAVDKDGFEAGRPRGGWAPGGPIVQSRGWFAAPGHSTSKRSRRRDTNYQSVAVGNGAEPPAVAGVEKSVSESAMRVRRIRTRSGETAGLVRFLPRSTHRFESAVPKACSSRFGWGARRVSSGSRRASGRFLE